MGLVSFKFFKEVKKKNIFSCYMEYVMHGRARKLEGAVQGPALEVLRLLGGRGEAEVRRLVMKAWKKTGRQIKKRKSERRSVEKVIPIE